MFKKARPKTKPPLLTIAMRANVRAHNESVIEQKPQSKSIWNTLRGHRKWLGGSSDYQDAVASIERDVDAMVSKENNNHQHDGNPGQVDSPALSAPTIIAGAVWRWRWRIVAMTLLGGIAGVVVAFAAPQIFTADSGPSTPFTNNEPIIESQVEPTPSASPTASSELGGQLAQLKTAVDNAERQANAFAAETTQEGDALNKLRQFELEIEAARALYEAALLQSGGTNPTESLVSTKATVTSVAEAPLNGLLMSRNLLAPSGALVGFMIGLGAAIVAGLRESIQASKNSPAQPLPKVHNRSAIGRQNYSEGPAVQSHPASHLHPMASDSAPMRRSIYDRPQQLHQDVFGLSREEELEMEEMRASMREIRQVLDHLKQTRSARQRYG